MIINRQCPRCQLTLLADHVEQMASAGLPGGPYLTNRQYIFTKYAIGQIDFI